MKGLGSDAKLMFVTVILCEASPVDSHNNPCIEQQVVWLLKVFDIFKSSYYISYVLLAVIRHNLTLSSPSDLDIYRV